MTQTPFQLDGVGAKQLRRLAEQQGMLLACLNALVQMLGESPAFAFALVADIMSGRKGIKLVPKIGLGQYELALTDKSGAPIPMPRPPDPAIVCTHCGQIRACQHADCQRLGCDGGEHCDGRRGASPRIASDMTPNGACQRCGHTRDLTGPGTGGLRCESRADCDKRVSARSGG